jgi:hypothetical protein
MKKVSKSDMPHMDITLTDEIKMNALKSEVAYWQLRYELALKYCK